MRTICLLALLFSLGCSSPDRPTTIKHAHSDDSSVTILQDLEYYDALSAGIQHPLVCGTGGDYPNGRELTFRRPQSTDLIHAVFLECIAPPSALDGAFVLYGHFQPIQKQREGVLVKRPGEDYQYFVVTSWKQDQ